MTQRLKRITKRCSIPGEAGPIFDDYVHRLRHFYANEGEFIESVIAYALWCEKEHHLTGPSFNSREARRKMWDEIIADYGKPKKIGSFFEHCLEEIAERNKR
ncbi:MAG TPA: hypothetical protein VK474_09015 [Chthoniobacterales bacterium]|nr:hypothetical protein [Chthoniobacterales bacterium]